jgi:hypothetical protein
LRRIQGVKKVSDRPSDFEIHYVRGSDFVFII